MFVDTHAHLTGDEIFPHVEDVIERAKLADVTKIINICTDLTTLYRGLELVKRHPFVYNAAAIHPHDVDQSGETDFPKIAELAKANQLIAIGETGLDYHYTHSSKEMQKKCLLAYAKLAQELNLPLIIHCREAFHDLFSFLDFDYNKVILHCFTGTQDEADEVVRRNWYISFSGVVTFKKSEELRKIAASVPQKLLLIETDAPFLAPHPLRGKPNEPSYLPMTAKVVADARGISVEALAQATEENAVKLFKL